MDPLLISVLGEALITVLKKLGENVSDPLLKRSAEPLQQLITRGYDQRKDEVRLRAMLEAAAKDFKPAAWRQYRFDLVLQAITSNPKLAVQVATVAVGMTDALAERVPYELLIRLGLEKERRPAFAKFLFGLRRQLIQQEDFRIGIEYVDRLQERGLLESSLATLRRQLEIQIEIYQGMLLDRGLTSDGEKALREYLEHVREQSQFMPLPLTRQRVPGKRMDVELNEVFVPLTVRDLEREQKNTGNFEADSPLVKPDTFAEVFNRHSCFLLIGPPGCGKTTLLHRAALSFAAGTAQVDLGWSGPLLLPIFLRLRNFGAFLTANRNQFVSPAPGALIAFMENHFREEYRLKLSPRFFDNCLRDGRCLVLLDGLDEVATDRQDVAQFVSAFIQEYGRRENRFGLASRPKGYEAVERYLRWAKPSVVEVNPLDAEGIHKLVGNLFTALETNAAQRARDIVALPYAILSSPKLRTMAGTPLFCAALVLVYKYHGARLPQQRAEVYSQIIDLLLGLWKAGDPGLSRAHDLASQDGTGRIFIDISDAVAVKKQRLSHLALWMQENGVSDVPLEVAREVLKEYLQKREGSEPSLALQWAGDFLRNAHEFSGLFVEMEAERYAFTHQGFREFLAATALKNKREQEFLSLVRGHATDDWWEEVILLAAAHPELAAELREYLIEVLLDGANDPNLSADARHTFLLLSGQCTADMAQLLPNPRRNQVIEKLYDAMIQKDLEPKKRLQAGETLDALGWIPTDLDHFVPIQGLEHLCVSKYPVTNLQYLRFLSSLDYTDHRVWKSIQGFDLLGQRLDDIGEQAWEWFTQNGGQELRPRFWEDPKFGASRNLFPIIGVSWFEAAAYCAWLNWNWEELGLPFSGEVSFRLPLEQEWVKVVAGEAEYAYPWQYQSPDIERATIPIYANTYESRHNGTTPVCMYPDGKNQVGVMDLSGNVWEWQANQHSTGKTEFALRGGAWTNGWDVANVASRTYEHPSSSGKSSGFRVLLCRENQG